MYRLHLWIFKDLVQGCWWVFKIWWDWLWFLLLWRRRLLDCIDFMCEEVIYKPRRGDGKWTYLAPNNQKLMPSFSNPLLDSPPKLLIHSLPSILLPTSTLLLISALHPLLNRQTQTPDRLDILLHWFPLLHFLHKHPLPLISHFLDKLHRFTSLFGE